MDKIRSLSQWGKIVEQSLCIGLAEGSYLRKDAEQRLHEMKRLLAIVVFFTMPMCSAFSQEDIAPFVFIPELPRALALSGFIDSRTPLVFRRALNAHPNVNTLILNNGGGDVQAGLNIAEIVFDRKISTFIPEGFTCASACSFVLFAGQTRLVDGRLGIHQMSGSSDIAGVQLNVSDIIDTLNKYGVDQRIFPIMFRTSSGDIHYFTKDEIQTFNINRTSPNVQGQLSTVPSPATSAPLSTSPQLAQPTKSREVYARENAEFQIFVGGEPNDVAMQFANLSYADKVQFFGKTVMKQQILDDKKKYFSRWPIRSYKPRTDTFQINCDANACWVKGEYDWKVWHYTNKKTLSGTATFTYAFDMNDGMKIIFEDGKSRK